MPAPPGIINTSSSGAVSNVCVGVIIGQVLELKGFMEADMGSVVTGSIVSEIRAKSILW